MNIRTITGISILSVALWYACINSAQTAVKTVSSNKKTETQVKKPAAVTKKPTTNPQKKSEKPCAPVVTKKKETHEPLETPKERETTQSPASADSMPTIKTVNNTITLPTKTRYKIDGIRSIVFGKESTVIITISDVKRPGLDGSPRELNDLEMETLMYQDALAKKMAPDDDSIDRNLNTVRKENNNMSLEQLKEVFKAAGYTYHEGREQFKIMMAVNSILDFMIRSRLLVPEKDVRAYYDENPIYEEAAYKIERAFIPFSASRSASTLRKELIAYAHGTKLPSYTIEWSPPFWINEADIAQDKKFITHLEANQISEPVEISGGFELFRLKEKLGHRLKPLEERYVEIANILRKPRYEKLFDEYKKSLLEASSIVRFD